MYTVTSIFDGDMANMHIKVFLHGCDVSCSMILHLVAPPKPEYAILSLQRK